MVYTDERDVMDVLFDSTARAVLNALGYNYFCTREEWAPEDEEKGYVYWQLIPFTKQYEALEYYFDCLKTEVRCHVYIEDHTIQELALGIQGLIIQIRSIEYVLV